MAVDANVLEALDLKQLDLPESLPITGIEVEDYVDWTGDDALRVTLILDENVDPTRLGKDASDLHMQIHDRLLARGVEKFPYVSFVKESERQQEAE
ncbi:MAG: hypothetical protein KY475_19115 [Planctomycetes bacterium]|nr:hypothetical protein [Planctomycetota bacterium]